MSDRSPAPAPGGEDEARFASSSLADPGNTGPLVPPAFGVIPFGPPPPVHGAVPYGPPPPHHGPHHGPPPPHHGPHHGPPPPHDWSRGGNSLLSETLMELAPTFTDVNTVEAVVRELDEDALPLVARVAAEGITHPVLFVTRFVELESLERLRARQTMLEDVGQGAAVVIYPLPPYLADLLRPVLRRELTFDSGPIAQVHFQHDAIQGLSYDKLLLLTSMPAGVTSLVLDGQRRGKVLTVRANAASVLELIARNSLQRVFLHRIPHVPRGEQFVTLDVTNKAVEILDV